jgi:hypothetical protein
MVYVALTDIFLTGQKWFVVSDGIEGKSHDGIGPASR